MDGPIVITPETAQFRMQVEPTHWKQYKALLTKEFRVKVRSIAASSIPVLEPVWILFILIVLNLNLSRGILSPEPKPFLTLQSKCIRPDCVLLAYTNTSSIDPVLTQLSAILQRAEPNGKIEYVPDLIQESIASPGRIVVGVEFTNIASLFTSGPNISVAYNLFVNNTIFVQGFDDARLLVASQYIETALQNVHRAFLNVPLVVVSDVSFSKVQGQAISGIQFLMAYYFAFMFQPVTQSILTRLAKEKEDKIKLGLLMMGTSEMIYLVSVLSVECFFGLFTVLLVTVASYLGKIFTYSSPLILIVLMVEFSVGLAATGALLSIIAPNPRQTAGASTVFMLVSLVSFGLCQAFVWKLKDHTLDHIVMLLPTVAFARAIDVIATSETLQEGIGFGNLNGTHVQMALYMMLADIILYSILMLYLNCVFPGENGGTALPWNFPFKLFLDKDNRKEIPSGTSSQDPNELVENMDISSLEESNRKLVSVQGITKVFHEKGFFSRSKEELVAVNNIFLDFHGGQVFVLLGHNGAGKTTLISSIIGIAPPSNGDVFVKLPDGSVVRTTDPNNLAVYQKHLGICPQFDVLFENLTVKEHLQLYAQIKGVSHIVGLDLYLESLADDVELKAKLNNRISTLSGGMKRKLRYFFTNSVLQSLY
jgi:ABC-type lipoprotein export system ATPase subunit/ABC-type multidrug transport system permease subunit